MEEDLTFATPGSLPIKRNYNGYPIPPYTQGYQHYQPPNHGYQHHQPPNQGYQHHQPPNQGYQHYHPQKQGYQHHQPQEQGYQPPSHQAASWMTPEIRTELQMRNKLKETSQRSPEDRKAYQAQCEKVQHMIDESKANVGIPTVSTSPYSTVSRAPRMNHNMNGQQESGSFDPTTTHHNQNTASFDPNTAYRHSQNPASYYNHDSQASHKVHTCGPCNRSYFSKYKLEEHLKEHVECPFPECKLSAHIKVIDQHINNQHMLVNFANLQIDDETWIAERKKRFPTIKRAELRRAEQIEKIKRGEKLGKSSKPFNNNRISSGRPHRGKIGEQNTTRKEINNRSANVKESGDGNTRNNSLQETQKNQSEKSGIHQTGKEKDIQATPEERGGAGGGRGRFRHNWRRGERPAYPPRAHLDVDMFESSDEDKPPPFKGTRHFYESTGEVSYFSISSNKLDTEDADQDMEVESEKTNNICISDEEEWPAADSMEKPNTGSGELVLGGALGSLMGAYSDSEEEETTPAPVRKQQDKSYLSAPANGKTPIANSTYVADSQTTTAAVKEKDKEEISRPGPSEGSNNTERPAWKHRNRKRQRPQRNQDTKGKEKKPPVVPVFKRFRRRRKTLLEKLLMPDIIHERNVMLQCVKFIVENNFFDGGQSDSVQEEGSDVLQQEEAQTVTDDVVERNNLEQQGETGTVTDGGVEREQDGQQQKQNETVACDELKKDLVQEEEMIETDAGGSKAKKNTTQQEQMEIVSGDKEKTVANDEVTKRKVESLANGGEERRDGAQKEEVLKTVVSDGEVSKMMKKDSNEMEKVNDDSKVTTIITKDNKIAERDEEEKRDVIEQKKVMETVPHNGEVTEKEKIEVERITDGDKVPERKVKEMGQANDNGECSR
ncbi:hypothetical protein Pmani_008170 [Petrolisthes manimaculis]|uniref:C2H2-type domain-containing protein n=1 Tax=Petrolisthes manimaculis TaxID=1843537 RepID=A0AAE1UJX5_9EUCA|nr:hypothetical protein Pmani_008170 [Petrolisthes manimaculis]